MSERARVSKCCFAKPFRLETRYVISCTIWSKGDDGDAGAGGVGKLSWWETRSSLGERLARDPTFLAKPVDEQSPSRFTAYYCLVPQKFRSGSSVARQPNQLITKHARRITQNAFFAFSHPELANC